MDCIVPSRHIYTCDCPNYCNYNAAHSFVNSSRLKIRRCELILTLLSDTSAEPYLIDS